MINNKLARASNLQFLGPFSFTNRIFNLLHIIWELELAITSVPSYKDIMLSHTSTSYHMIYGIQWDIKDELQNVT
jgi:hypothetical protein